MLMVESVELVGEQHRAEIVVLDHQHRVVAEQPLQRCDHAAEVLDMREHIGEGDEVGLAVSGDDLLGGRLGEEIMDRRVPLGRAILRRRGRLDADGDGALR